MIINSHLNRIIVEKASTHTNTIICWGQVLYLFI